MVNYAMPDHITLQKLTTVFKKLFDADCLIAFKDNEEFDKIFERTNSIMKISEAKFVILQDDELLDNYKKFWAGHFINEFDIYNDFMQQAASYLLSMFEHIKRFLMMFLDLKKMKLREKSTLGIIVIEISKKCGYSWDSLNDLFDVNTRNIIGHDNWYYKEKNFAYKDENGVEKEITLSELVEKIKYVTSLSSAIAMVWQPYMVKLEIDRYKENKRNVST